ncbi:hypothetical protein HanRHA438_Chr04g0176841 [Helianthus annuus]|nr:hypothetical protein HanRHA438_Chr04g0176841 [Helianthus annuus]
MARFTFESLIQQFDPVNISQRPRFGPTRSDPVFGAVRLGSVQLGSTWCISARLGPTRSTELTQSVNSADLVNSVGSLDIST